ncbi:MAG: SDR family oxidoreductase [Acidobacteria bacterium]|nr:MAG: SDR family oxidoreductase [Acidobacteriota bacterium]
MKCGFVEKNYLIVLRLMKATLITGASSGIGEAFARRLAKEKHNLVLVARSEEKLKELCIELASKNDIVAEPIALDLSEEGADEKVFGITEHKGFEINWLINNAGFGSMGYFAELDLEREIQMINLNIKALVALTHRYLGKMKERGEGVVINVSSAASFQPLPFMATYAATKAFVTSFTEAIAEEYRPFGITIQALCPGPTKTNFFKAANTERIMTIKKMQTPEEVVETALRAVRKKKMLVISGLSNKIGAFFGQITPDWIVTRAVASVLRARMDKKLEKAEQNGQES